MKKSFCLFLLLFSVGCKSDVELAMERGIQFYEWDRIEEAILEFKYVIHSLGAQSKKNYGEIKLLSRAHHNLAVSYAKKKWYTDATDEAQKAFELFPTDDNRNIFELIKKKKSQKIVPKPAKSDSTSL
jgi:hypothetical protein